MSNEQIAHELSMLVIEKFLEENRIQISPNPQTTSSEITNYYSIYKSNILRMLDLIK